MPMFLLPGTNDIQFKIFLSVSNFVRQNGDKGHFIINHLRDDKDILWQCHNLYGQGNILFCKFNMCSGDVKFALFPKGYFHLFHHL